MTPEFWQQIEAAFNTATDLPHHQLPAFLNQLSPELRQQVSSLLAAENIPLTLSSEIVDNIVQLQQSDPRNNQRLGPYRILGELGAGGMGSVFKATRDDDAYQMIVAIKIIRANLAHTQLEARFRAERQILAQLEHPYIARLIDGGTHDGLPYIVMEYIEGQPIDQYVKHHKLSTKDRLILFRKVCEAVQHAHQRLIVHRDLKPGNILVLPDGTPKLLDFGIAKLLDQETNLPDGPLTQTGWLLMTPDYASPEQVRGQSITVASDVYSLAVILYELLTGERPYKLKNYSPSEIQDLVCSQEVAAPSSRVTRASKLRRQLEGDLDNVLLMALRKEPQRRYQSVEQFSEDLRRHLIGETVTARPDTFVYRSSKFLKRNRLSVALATILVLSILAGAFFTYREGLRAQRRFTQVRAIANRVLTEFDPEAAKLPGATKLRASMVRASMEYLDSLAVESLSDPQLQHEVAFAYSRVGDTLGYIRATNLNQPFEAAIAYTKAIQICEANQSRPDSRRLLAYLYAHFATLGPRLGKANHARTYFEKALPLLDNSDLLTTFEVRHGYAHFLTLQGQLDEAAAILQPALETMVSKGSPQMSMGFLEKAGYIEASRGNLPLAIRHVDRGLEISRRTTPNSIGIRRASSLLYLSRSRLAYSMQFPSQWDACTALPLAKVAAEISLSIYKDESRDRLTSIATIDYLQNLTSISIACQPTRPPPSLDQAREIYKFLNLGTVDLDTLEAKALFLQGNPQAALLKLQPFLEGSSQQLDTVLIAADIYFALNRPNDALKILAPTLKLAQTAAQSKAFDAIIYRERVLPLALALGNAYQQTGRTSEATNTWRAALATVPTVSGKYPIAPSTAHWQKQLESRLNP